MGNSRKTASLLHSKLIRYIPRNVDQGRTTDVTERVVMKPILDCIMPVRYTRVLMVDSESADGKAAIFRNQPEWQPSK